MAGCGRHTQNGALYCSSTCLEHESRTTRVANPFSIPSSAYPEERRASFQSDSSCDLHTHSHYNNHSQQLSSGRTIPRPASPRPESPTPLLPFRNRGGLNYSLARPPSPHSPPQNVGHWGIWDST
ncbi:hypothetical protein SpCBS45565_g02588 [Spizellomyces sp. 'palustris']|nr:hypothetical protein SpCBS45565_g02588 [Spizellomyces sp. 'palustris']